MNGVIKLYSFNRIFVIVLNESITLFFYKLAWKIDTEEKQVQYSLAILGLLAWEEWPALSDLAMRY
jgi:hypothetical protein